MEPEVRYCTTADGIRIVYTVTGEGPPFLVCTDPIVSHTQLEWSHPVSGRIGRELARHFTMIRLDFRGSGLSDRVLPQTVDDWVLDIEAVVQRTGFRDFALCASQFAAVRAAQLVSATWRRRIFFQMLKVTLVSGQAKALTASNP